MIELALWLVAAVIVLCFAWAAIGVAAAIVWSALATAVWVVWVAVRAVLEFSRAVVVLVCGAALGAAWFVAALIWALAASVGWFLRLTGENSNFLQLVVRAGSGASRCEKDIAGRIRGVWAWRGRRA